MSRDLPHEWDFDSLEAVELAKPAPEVVAHQCVNCGLSPSFEGFTDCLQCCAAWLIHDPTQLALMRKLHAGTPWLATLNAEINRQLGTPIACGSAAA